LLSIDDAHLLDDHSATLVLQLAMSMPSFVVATVRTGEPVPDAVLALWKEGLAERVDVGRLDDASIGGLVEQVLGGPADAALAGAITMRADGNALFARELCLSGRDAGVITQVEGRWSVVGTLGVSPRLVELVRARIDGLPPAERGPVDLVAHGEPIGQRLATGLVGAEALLALEQRGLVVLREDGRRREVWLSHPMYAEVLRAMSGPMLAATLKGRLAAAMTGTGMRRRSDLLRVATWQLESGAGDPELLRRAATETYRAGDMGSTARLAVGAWDLRPDANLSTLLGTALGYSGRYAEADAIFAAGEELATDDAERTRVAVVHAAILSAGLGQPEAAIELLAETERRVVSESDLAQLRGQRAHLLALGGQPDAALEIVEPLLARVDSGPVFVTAAMAGIIAMQLTGKYRLVVELAERMLPETRRLWASGEVSIPPEIPELEAFGASVAMGELRDLPVIPIMGDAGRHAASLQNRPVAMLAALHMAALELHRGHPVTAAAAIQAASPVASDLLAAPSAAVEAICASLVGDAHAAASHLERAISWRRPGSIFDPFVDSARIWVLVAQGQPEGARRAATAALQEALGAHRWGQAMELAHILARIGGAEAAEAAFGAIGERVDGAFAVQRREHVAALVADDPDGLERAATGFATMGRLLLAAESSADAARAARRAGDPRRATRLLRQAETLASGCEGARTLIVLQDELTPLSRREIEVADLAAAGLSSEEIAGRLFLSVRTVDNHLQHVYQKLGIASRSELAGTVGRGRRPG
ncbi:MAG: LuxR C-terminal-related transcriptional regulator, partial [Chloroflexota bacterium]|nr:LuxR C-terminal-related transcriptional regulator [Chloroflexota bacterium]